MKNKKSPAGYRFFGLQKLLPYLKPYRFLFLSMLCTGVASISVDILTPILQRYALNHYIAEQTLDTLPFFIALYVGLILLLAITNGFSGATTIRLEVRLNRDLRNAAFHRLQALSFSYYNQNSVGYLHARVMSDASRIGSQVAWTTIGLIWRVTYLIGSIAVMLRFDWRLTLKILAVFPVMIFFFTLFQRKLLKIDRRVREMNSRISADYNESITGAKTVKSLVIEDTLQRDFVRSTGDYYNKSVQSARVRGLLGVTLNLATSTTLAVVLWKGGYIAAAEVGTFSLFMSYTQGLMEPIRWLVDCVSNLVTLQVNTERLFGLIETESDVKDSPAVIEKYGDSFHPKRENWEQLHGDIEFRDVTFRYPDGDETVLEHFNLKIPFGSTVAIVGETGAGKSTLVNLLCRFFEPTAGQVLIDGRDARERSQLWLHSALGYVLQTPHLFSGSIKENLLYGNPNATDAEIADVLRLCSADAIIDRLPQGLDTPVGEGGDGLSTGEKQLISFARAILANPKILVLDEATASVDTLTEQHIQAAVETVIRGRTAVIIAHRLSTVQNADCILAVQNGKIVEQGTHRQLLERRGYYYRLYTRQYEDERIYTALQAES